ncbi:MAG: histidine phosphatase family protein [Ilumatobacteraceae bacterium]
MTDHSIHTSNANARIIMVRHGESEWNVLGKWQGRADTKLTDAGRSQARDAARSIAESGIAIHRIVASSLSRARETAEIVATTLSLDAPEVDDRLVETDVGPWEGLREHEIEAAWPNYLRDRRTPPNFEPPHTVFERATSLLRELHEKEKNVLVVSHSGVIRTIRRMMEVPDRRLHNLEGCYFHLDADGRLVAGDFISLATASRPVVNDAV